MRTVNSPQRENAAVSAPLPSAPLTFVAPNWSSYGFAASGAIGSSGHTAARAAGSRNTIRASHALGMRGI
ncbi:MAG: hypothetical protein E6J68_01825 [Deltaproteobacteria bacterium]|nr:MAG: hypothetical protein E6J68_01825 [Deltaproteobacteria bacterium]